jgi:outer membrane protein assembly factor BamB
LQLELPFSPSGKRATMSSSLGLAAVVAACYTALVHASGDAAPAAPAWPQVGYDCEHSSRSPNLGPGGNASLLWGYSSGFLSGAPVVGSGMVYASFQGGLIALDAILGTVRWTGNGGATTPAVGPSGTVYVGTGQPSADSVTAFGGLNGAKLWTSQLGRGGSQASSPTVSVDGTVYITTISSGLQQCLINALHGGTGDAVWTAALSGYTAASPPALGPDGTVYVSCSNKVYALDGATGAYIWSYTTGGSVTAAPTVSPLGVVFVGSWDSRVYALNASDGTQLWNFTTLSGVQNSASLAADGTVYVASSDAYLYAFDGETGVLQWRTTAPGSGGAPSIAADGTLFLTSSSGSAYGNIYAINASNGNVYWSLNIGSTLTTAVAIGAKGVLYVGTNEYVYAVA